jgi:hypothetical protein
MIPSISWWSKVPSKWEMISNFVKMTIVWFVNIWRERDYAVFLTTNLVRIQSRHRNFSTEYLINLFQIRDSFCGGWISILANRRKSEKAKLKHDLIETEAQTIHSNLRRDRQILNGLQRLGDRHPDIGDFSHQNQHNKAADSHFLFVKVLNFVCTKNWTDVKGHSSVPQWSIYSLKPCATDQQTLMSTIKIIFPTQSYA